MVWDLDKDVEKQGDWARLGKIELIATNTALLS